MALTAQQAREIAIALTQAEPGAGATSKTDLIAAATATDAWLTTMTTAYTAQLPLPFRTGSTVAQRNALLTLVAQRRWKG